MQLKSPVVSKLKCIIMVKICFIYVIQAKQGESYKNAKKYMRTSIVEIVLQESTHTYIHLHFTVFVQIMCCILFKNDFIIIILQGDIGCIYLQFPLIIPTLIPA